MNLVIDIADYKIESCKRRIKDGLADWYHYMIANATPLEEELEKIREEIEENAYEISCYLGEENEESKLMIELSDLQGILDKHISELKGEHNAE